MLDNNVENIKPRKRGGKFYRNENKNTASSTENSLIYQSFKKYALEIDDKHDRYERIVKISRDITIESKRIIFLLHTIDSNTNNTEKILKEAKERLEILCTRNFLGIANELKGLDPYQYIRAYTGGLQEFVEAYSFYEYLNQNPMLNWNDIQSKLYYEPSIKLNIEDNSMAAAMPISCFVSPLEFILGLADLTGEIMRRCINALGSADFATCFASCHIMQQLYSGFLRISLVKQKELSRKIYTLKQSVLKTENVCFNIKVRGKEAAKLGTDKVFISEENNVQINEGFYT